MNTLSALTGLMRVALAANKTSLGLALGATRATADFARTRFDAREQVKRPQLFTKYFHVATDRIEAESTHATTDVSQQAVPGGRQAVGSADAKHSVKFVKFDFGASVIGIIGHQPLCVTRQSALKRMCVGKNALLPKYCSK